MCLTSEKVLVHEIAGLSAEVTAAGEKWIHSILLMFLGFETAPVSKCI